MASSSIRVDDATIATLRRISAKEQRPIGQIVTDLVDRYQNETFWDSMHQAFTRLRQDPAAWEDYQAEVAEWDAVAVETIHPERASND